MISRSNPEFARQAGKPGIKPTLLGVMCMAAGAVSLPAAAALSQAGIVAPGGFISAYAGLGNGSSPWPGSDYASAYNATDMVLNEQTFASGTATASSNYSGTLGTNSSTGYVTFGALGYSAANSASNSGFALGAANGGWTDSILISDPALNGQSGIWMFQIDASGSLAVSGFAGAASFQVTGYKNGSQLMLNSYFDNGNSDAISTDRQAAVWGIASYGNSDSRTVSDTVTFAVPFTWGTSFNLGIYAAGQAGKRSSSGVAGISTSELNFMNTLLWGGTSCMLYNGSCVTGYSITSGSGTNWDMAYASAVPVPSAVWLFGSGLLGVVGMARRKRA